MARLKWAANQEGVVVDDAPSDERASACQVCNETKNKNSTLNIDPNPMKVKTTTETMLERIFNMCETKRMMKGKEKTIL